MKQSIVKQEKITNCRLCSSDILKKVLTLKNMPFTDEFVTYKNIGKEFLSDIEIGVCMACGSTQNLNNTDMTDYYFDYTYSVQSSSFATNFMRTLAQRIKDHYFKQTPSPIILEIGSGSGEQLLEFKKLGFEILGIEPSDKLSKYANSIGVNTITTFFDEQTKDIVENHFSSLDAIVASYTFDHIPQIDKVLANIHNILNTNGLLIIEVHDLELICNRNEFCLFEHEHYIYLNKATITQLFNNNQFEVLTFDLLSSKEKRGNSLLVVARKIANKKLFKVNLENEISKLINLENEIKASIKRIDSWLIENKNQKIAAYGAGGRGIMTIAALKHPELISYIVDKNPKAENIYSPKSHLPVYTIDELAHNRVDIIIVFSFGYYDEIVNEIVSKYGYQPDQFISILKLLNINYE